MRVIGRLLGRAARGRRPASTAAFRDAAAARLTGGLHLCGVMDPACYADPEWRALHDEIETYSIDKHVFFKTAGDIVRKGWEITHCAYGLAKLGMIRPDARALGVGTGHDPTAFYLADRIGCVIATDLYGNEQWSSNEADPGILSDPAGYCAREMDLSRLRFWIADGRQLPFADDSFDFCWSLSSIEHFGGPEGAVRAMSEMARVTRPDGIVCVATEYLLLPEQHHVEAYTRAELEKYLLGAAATLVPVDSLRYDGLPAEFLIDSVPIPHCAERMRRHVVLNNGEAQWTSIILFLRKTARR